MIDRLLDGPITLNDQERELMEDLTASISKSIADGAPGAMIALHPCTMSALQVTLLAGLAAIESGSAAYRVD